MMNKNASLNYPVMRLTRIKAANLTYFIIYHAMLGLRITSHGKGEGGD